MLQFDKYEKRGAYHWDWYKINKYQYTDHVHMMLAHLPTSGTLIDIGGGDGLISYLAFKNGLAVTCIDNNSEGIEIGKQMVKQVVYGTMPERVCRFLLNTFKRRQSEIVTRYEGGDLQFITQSIFDLKINETFDYAICHEVIEHVPEPEKLIKFIVANVKHYAIISTPDVTNREPHELDYNNWTPESLGNFLTDYKFEFILRDGFNMYIKLYCEGS